MNYLMSESHGLYKRDFTSNVLGFKVKVNRTKVVRPTFLELILHSVQKLYIRGLGRQATSRFYPEGEGL